MSHKHPCMLVRLQYRENSKNSVKRAVPVGVRQWSGSRWRLHQPHLTAVIPMVAPAQVPGAHPSKGSHVERSASREASATHTGQVKLMRRATIVHCNIHTEGVRGFHSVKHQKKLHTHDAIPRRASAQGGELGRGVETTSMAPTSAPIRLPPTSSRRGRVFAFGKKSKQLGPHQPSSMHNVFGEQGPPPTKHTKDPNITQY